MAERQEAVPESVVRPAARPVLPHRAVTTGQGCRRATGQQDRPRRGRDRARPTPTARRLVEASVSGETPAAPTPVRYGGSAPGLDGRELHDVTLVSTRHRATSAASSE